MHICFKTETLDYTHRACVNVQEKKHRQKKEAPRRKPTTGSSPEPNLRQILSKSAHTRNKNKKRRQTKNWVISGTKFEADTIEIRAYEEQKQEKETATLTRCKGFSFEVSDDSTCSFVTPISLSPSLPV